jgi:hypothetical protein
MSAARAIAILAAVLGAGAALGAPPAEPPAHAHAQARVQRVHDPHGKPHAGHLRGSRARAVTLAPPAAGEVESLLGTPRPGIPLKVGFARDVPGLDTAPATSGALDWQRLDDGSLVADLRITSQGAKAVRGVLRVESLPPQAVLRFQAPNDDQLFEVTGQEVADALARDADAGAPPGLANLYWSPVTEGPTVVVEIELPPGTDPAEVRLSVPKVSHLARSPVKDTFTTQSSATCERDAMCSASQWGSQMNAVARMIFSDGTYSYACTGTLLADSDPSGDIPYFLTANHCINTQTEASSLNTYWFYRSTACNSGVPGAYRQLGGGATLLYNTSATDTSFLRLDATPPAGAVYAGWTVGTTPSVGATATGLHHPMADLLKISSGRVGGYLDCTPPNTSGQFSCSGSSAGSSHFYEIDWGNGITESGSSGSGVFDANGNLIGQLYGGSSSCSVPGADAYGRFDVAYDNGLERWLGAADQPLTVAKAGSGSGTVTSTPAGIACGSTCSASFPAGTAVSLAAVAGAGSRFAGWGGACSGTGACSVTLDAARNVTASFAPTSGTLSVIKGAGGTVTSAPAGIACGSTCSAAFPVGSALTLTETPASGYAFSGWSGLCSGTSPTCSISLNGAVTVGATFVASPPPPGGDGTGATGDVAAASAGAVASASSTLGTRYPASALIDGDRTGAAGIWEDANAYTFPDWVQVQFAAPRTIDRVVVYSMQDAYSRPVEPTDTMTFHSYGVTGFSVQAWNGSAWTTLATVAGNDLVKRTVTFAPTTTDRIRVVVVDALNGYSRIAEVEAWSVGSGGSPAPGAAAIGLTSSVNPSTEGQAVTFTASLTGAGGTPTGSVAFADGGAAIAGCTAVPLASGVASCTSAALLAGSHSITASYAGSASYAPATSTPLTQVVQPAVVSGGSGTETDVAAASADASAVASSTIGTRYPASAVIDGDRTGAGFGNGGVWEDANGFVFPDWVEIRFAGVKTIDRVVVYSMQDGYTHPVDPGDTLTFHSYGVTAFTVQAWDGAEWETLGRVSGNDLVKRTVTFPAVATDRIRVVIDDALNGYSRLAEVEAWGD